MTESGNSGSSTTDSDSEDDTNIELVSLFSALHVNNYTNAKEIINRNRSLINSNLNGSFPLHEAIKQRIKCKDDVKEANRNFIEDLLNMGADQNVTNLKGETALTIVKKQLRKKANSSEWQAIEILLQTDIPTSSRGMPKNPSLMDISSSAPVEPSTTLSVKRRADSESDIDIKRTKSTETYAVSGLKTSLHGTIYQLQLLMLWAHRGIEHFFDFDLATEMNQAEKFDDVVVKYRKFHDDKWTWRFLQAKHKDDPGRDRITINSLLTETDGPFSLQKYFLSYCMICNNSMFKEAELAEFDLCTNTELNLTEILTCEAERNLSPTAKNYNNLVGLWKDLLNEENCDDDALLFFHGVGSKKYKFKPQAAVEFQKLIERLFFTEDFQTQILKDKQTLKNKINYKKLVAQAHMVDEANLMCETLKILLDSTRAEKGKFSELAKKILKLKGIFLTNDKYDELTKVFALFVETKVTDKLYLARRNELYSACESLLRNIVDIVNEAHCKLNSYQDSGSSQYTLLEEEISTIDKHKTQYIALKTMIWNCTNLIDLHNKISSFPDIANKLQAKDTKNLDLGGIQKKLSTILEKNITDCVMLELAGNEHKLATYIQQFLEKFRLVTCYPDVDKLNILLKRELGKKFAFINADLITDSFQKQMLDWFKEYNKGKSDFLSSNQGRAFFKSIGSHITSLMTAGLNEAYPAKLKSFNLQFKTTDLNQIFPSSKNILHIITESTKLSAIKLLQVIDESQLYDSRDSFIFLPLSGFVSREIQKLVVSSFCAPNRHDLLVIECQKHIKLTTFPYINEFIEDIARVLRQNVKKKFILISQNGCDNIVDELVTFGCTRTHVVEDKNTFCQLKEECQENVLNRTIELQNAIVPLHQMIGLQSACDILNESALEGILLSSIQIGETDSFKSSYFVPEYYQQRHLHLQSLNYSVFEVNSAKFYVTNMEHTEYVKTHYHQLWSYIYKYSENIIQAKQNDDHEKVFQKLCNDNPDFLIYWLHHNNGKLYWKRSNNGFKNGMSAISIIQEHIIDNLTSSGNGFYHEENIKFSEKMVVVANNSGVGKSTFLTSMANIMKRLHKNWWICRISLNDYVFNRKYLPPTDSRLYTKNLEEIVDSLTSDQAVDFLADMVIPPNPQTLHRDFQREIFKLGLRNHDNVHPHLVLLFDGFDEISPVYKTKTITLLKALSATDIMQIWVTTRLHEKYSLEEAFHCVAYVLYPLNENQQINFLTNFWSYSLAQKSISDEDIVTYGNNLNIDIEYIKKCYDGNELSPVLELETFAENLINEWKMSASDEQKSFTHNPLHLKMIAEIVFLKNFEMTRQIGLVELFKTFLDLKFDIFYREKQILGHSVGALEVREDHSEPLRQKHRLLAFREVYPDVTDELEDPVGANDTSSLTRAGLLIRFGTRLTFIHRNFAEYLLVEYLTLTLNQVLTQKILFERIFSENKPSFIALIFNEFVCKNSLDICLTEPTIELIKNLAGVRYADIFLHHLYYGGFDNTLIFVLKALKHYPDIQEQVLLKPGIYGKFVMYDITHNSTRGRSLQEQESAIKIYLDYLADQPNILVKIFTSRYREMDVLLGNQEPEVTCLQVALFTTGTEKIFELFMDSIRNSKSHFREVLFKNGITSTDTILHFGCRFAYTKLHLLLRLLAPSNSEDRFVDILNDLILAKDSIGRTALHYLSFNRRPTLINTFISWVKDISENTLINLLSSVDNRRINPLDMAIYIDDSNTSRAFLDSLNINLSQEQFNALVFRNGLERSILFKAVIQGKTNSMITILEWLKERYAADGQNNIRVITEMLKERHDICGRTSITIASARNFSQTLEKLFYWIRDVCENATEGILFQLLSMKDNDGKTILHEATLFGTQSLSLLIQFITQHFSCYDLAEILLSKSNANKTALDLAKTSETKELLWSCIYIIFQTVIKLSNITHVSDYPVKFNETQLTVLEEIAHTHFQGNNERIIEAIDTVKCMMGFHCSSTMESPSTSTSIRHLSLPP